MVNSLFPVIQGLGYGLGLTENKRLENSVRAGGNNYFTALLQMVQGVKVVHFANKASQAAGFPVFSWARSVICFTPVLLAVLKDSTLLPETIRPIVIFCQNHLSTVYQIAAIVSSVSLLFFGQTAFAISSLSILGIGIMDRNGWLPLACRQFLHQYTLPLLILTSFISGRVFDQVYVVMNILLLCADRYVSRRGTLSEDFTFQENLTPQKALDFLNNRLSVRINKKFINYNPFPPVPDTDIQFFIEKFDQINWQKHIHTLRKKLRGDARFVDRHRDPDRKSDEEIISIARASLQSFISAIKERRVLAGEPKDYEKLHNYLKIIAKYLEGQKDEIIGTDIIFRLAVEGAEYCGPGQFEMAESLYAQIIGDNPGIPFRDKITYCLQDERNAWTQKLYTQKMAQNPSMSLMGSILDWHDVHTYNYIINLYGDELGLRKAGADNDDAALVDPLSKCIMFYVLGSKIHRTFWDEHTAEDHARILIDSIGTHKLPKPEVYDFWQDWIARQEIDESEKEELLDELADSSLYNRPIEMDGKLTSEFVTLMLLDMGIIEVVPGTLPDDNPLSSLRPVRV